MAAALCGGVLLTVSACGRGAIHPATVQITTTHGIPNSWVAADQTEAAYLQWTQTDGAVAGNLTVAYLASSDATSVQTRDASFTGTMNDSNLTLTFPQGLGFTRSATGTVQRHSL